jgi:hypothetical protein
MSTSRTTVKIKERGVRSSPAKAALIAARPMPTSILATLDLEGLRATTGALSKKQRRKSLRKLGLKYQLVNSRKS